MWPSSRSTVATRSGRTTRTASTRSTWAVAADNFFAQISIGAYAEGAVVGFGDASLFLEGTDEAAITQADFVLQAPAPAAHPAEMDPTAMDEAPTDPAIPTDPVMHPAPTEPAETPVVAMEPIGDDMMPAMPAMPAYTPPTAPDLPDEDDGIH